MNIIVNKASPKEVKYRAGDIISLGNPYAEIHYLLTSHHNSDCIGAVNLIEGKIEYVTSKSEGFEFLVRVILQEKDWDEWALIKSEDVAMTLNCKDGAMEQRNNSGLF